MALLLVIIMSNFGPSYAKATAVPEEQHYCIFQFVPSPGSDASADQANARAEVITALEKRAGDLAQPNYMHKASDNETHLYQTKETYGRPMSVETIIENMKASELTLRLRFQRPGILSSHSVFELAPGMLEKLIDEEVDETGVKMIELRVRAEAQASMPRNGAMFVSVEKKKGHDLHYFSNVDYKIAQGYDALFHR